MNMKILFPFCLILACEIKIIFADIKTITEYFNSDTYKTIQNQWQIERKSFENAIVLILEQNYGSRGVNVYVRKVYDFYKISDGFYFSDNVVDLILLDTYLQSLPQMFTPQVTIALASNIFHIKADLGKIIINTHYFLIRNQSEVVFSGYDQDPYQKSPFSFQQVQDYDELTIIADDCILAGYTITTINDGMVNLGHDTFKVKNCKFSIEIYSTSLGSPPIIAPYFLKQQSESLETMLTIPLKAELMTKLQAAVITYINTSAIFGDKLPDIRSSQTKVFEESSKFMSNVVRNFVKNTIQNNKGIIQLEPKEISSVKTCLNETCTTRVGLNNAILYGLDTAYSSHTGSAYKLETITLAESIRFSSMQVRGKLFFDNEIVNGERQFAVELRDVAVNIEMEAKKNTFALIPAKLNFVRWRTIEFSLLELGLFENERRVMQSFISGILINEIPKVLLEHFANTFGESEASEQQSAENTDDDVMSNESRTVKNTYKDESSNKENEISSESVVESADKVYEDNASIEKYSTQNLPDQEEEES